MGQDSRCVPECLAEAWREEAGKGFDVSDYQEE
jgi:hypothetical protein